MRIESLLRKLIPASIVALVLAFSYFAPALGLVAPAVQTGVGVNCGRFGYGYHGGKHLLICPNRPFPSPAIQPLGGVAPKPVSPPRAPALPVTPPVAPPMPARVASPVVVKPVVVASRPSAAPQAMGQVRHTGALARLAAEPSALILLVTAAASFGAAIALRLRRRRQP